MNPLNQPIVFHLSEQRERMNESIEMEISLTAADFWSTLAHWSSGVMLFC